MRCQCWTPTPAGDISVLINDPLLGRLQIVSVFLKGTWRLTDLDTPWMWASCDEKDVARRWGRSSDLETGGSTPQNDRTN
jgi:hypothetical protein